MQKLECGSVSASQIKADRICPVILSNYRKQDGWFVVADYNQPSEVLGFLGSLGSEEKAIVRKSDIINCMEILFNKEAAAARFKDRCCRPEPDSK